MTLPGGTPYITAAMLMAMPSSIAWQVIPKLTALAAAQTAQLDQECQKATSAVDRFCLQPLRAAAATQTETGPGYPRVSVERSTGLGQLITRRRFVSEVLAVQVAPARTLPPVWSPVPSGRFMLRNPMLLSAVPSVGELPDGGTIIDVSPGYISWSSGRGGQRVMHSTISGWPHTSLTADAAEGAETVTVDDVTAWTGSAGFAYDSTATEIVEVTSVSAAVPAQLPGVAGTVQAGPGTLTLSAPLASAHAAGTVISALPPDVIRATALQAAVQALEGIDAIAAQSLSGQVTGASGELAASVEKILCYYRNVI